MRIRTVCQKIFHLSFGTIKSVDELEFTPDNEKIQDDFANNIDKVWGVSFEGVSRSDKGFALTLWINENSKKYIINSINKEGRGGILEHIEKNNFRFTKDIFDANETMTWIKTFIGRILHFESTKFLKVKLDSDICRMAEMYGITGK